MIFNIALHILGRRQLAEEACQEVFLKLARRVRFYDSEKGALSTYLFNMAKGEAANTRQRENRLLFFEKVKDLFYFGEKNVEKSIFTKEIEAKIAAIIKTLPETKQKIFYLKFYAGLSTKEIATDLNLGENTIKTHILKTRELLINLLGDTYHQYFE